MATSDKVSAEKLLPFLKPLIDSCLQNAGALRFDKGHPQQLYAVCLYGTIVEITSGITALADARQITSIPILLRTLLDAYAGFRCCMADPNHFKAMYASFIKEKLRLVRTVIENPGNPYLKGIAQSIDDPKDRAELERELADLKKQGYEPLSPWQEFLKANLQAEYQSLYWQLCMHAHNNVTTLEDRHLEKKDGDYQVVFFKEEAPADVVRYLDSVCGILLDASLTLHNLLESAAIDEIERLGKKLQEIRAGYA